MKKIKNLFLLLGLAAGLGLGSSAAFAQDTFDEGVVENDFWGAEWDAGYDAETYEDDWYYDYYDTDYDYGWTEENYNWNDSDDSLGEDDYGDEGALDV